MTAEFELTNGPLDGKGPGNSTSRVHDQEELGRVGKKEILKRRFGFLSILGFSCTILATWEGLLSTFTVPLENGGSAGTVYGFIVVWAGTISTLTTLAEMVSMAPTSGGQYHWVSMMSPKRCQKYLSYLTGWLIVIGWLSAFVSTAFLVATQIQGLIILNHPTFDATQWQAVLLYWATIAFAVFFNIVISTHLPKVESFVLILHIIGFFAIIIPLVCLGEKNSTHEVFTTFTNDGGFSSMGVSFLVGMMGSMFAFTGADAAVHMSEEIHNAARVVPQSIIASAFVNGALGFGMILSTLYTMTNFEEAIDSPTGYPFMQIFYMATGSKAGSTVMSAIVPIISAAGAVGSLASSSRMVWSFSRDRGLPGWRFFSQVNSQAIPRYSILVVTVFAILLGLIILGSEAVLNDVISLCVSALYSSYFISASLLLWKRCAGGIRPAGDHPIDVIVNTPGAPLAWGPFYVPGLLGIAVNAFSVAYLFIGVFFSFWPDVVDPTINTMNWAVVGTAGTCCISSIYYFVWGHRIYTGPIVEIEMN
ncbi:GABA transporter [Aspergillus heteromorphus CBS 117.55]|uniref:GABA transporter n=1 Tax=Aspergillus heteromorphus CBS 117.55 TaxID=1448321 RepID=A0A317VTT0_9EURO|nr:GABA transporter [Aspergillus heteromorphus CBS 117.55]PWY76979.1 GABA transporter [Aspergillus heteromorphus CBS 117.55]